MDKSYVVEDRHKRNESLASASKISASQVQINSLAIDINCAGDEMDSSKHEHFSIRGFVSEMRKKDRKTCYPFSSEGKNDDDGMDLPSLSIPKFRWWQCPNCVPDFANLRSTFGMMLANKSDLAGVSCCQNINSSEKEGNDDNNYTSDEIIAFNPLRTDGYEAAANVRTTKIGTSSSHFPEANSIQIIEIREKSSDASDKVCSADNHSTNPNEPEKASSGRHKRKRKLRSLADIINEEHNFTIQRSRTKSLSSGQTEDDPNPHQPQLDVSSNDNTKSTNMSLTKRRNIVLENGEFPETSTPSFPAKKLKGSILESENNSNTCKRVEISESDLEKNDPIRPNVRITARKKQGLGNNRKIRRAIVKNRKAVQMTSDSFVHYANLGSSFGNKGNVDPLFKISLSGQEMGGFSDLSKDKWPEGGDFSVREKVPLDLSLRGYMVAGMTSKNQESSGRCPGIPDLNESFVDKTDIMEGQQVPDFSKTMSFALHEKSTISGSSSREMSREGKRPSGFLDYNNTVVECGPSSDEMEIVELLAKNQLDRAIDNSRIHLGSERINDSFKRAHHIKSTYGPVNFPYENPRTSLSVAGGSEVLDQGFFNFPQRKNCHPDKAQFRHSSPLTVPHQQIPLCPAPNSLFGPRLRKGVDLLWPPKRKKVTFDLTNTQSHLVRRNGLDDQSYRGKSVSFLRCDHLKNACKEGSLVREGRIGPGRMAVGSKDGYSNETIPAMQLLSLMDWRITGSSFKVGLNNFLDGQFSPCNHKPMLNENDDQNERFIGRSFFQKTNHANEFPALLNGARFSVESSKKYCSQVQMSPQKNSKAINVAGPSNLAYQPSKSGLRLEVCMLNRNPADFSLPDAKNEFMICAKDLTPRNQNLSKGKARPSNVEGLKRQKVRKNSSMKKARENNG